MDNGQLSLLDFVPEQVEDSKSGRLEIINANFISTDNVSWRELFEGFDSMYGITYSSGIRFMEKVMDLFSHVEMIFGCEEVLSDEIATIMSFQATSVEQIAKSKSAKRIAERIEAGEMILSVSRDTKSHEKIFILKANDGRKVASLKSDISKRVVTCFIGIKLDKEVGAKNSKKINESMRDATTALYCEYFCRMIPDVIKMTEEMRSGDSSYFPDIFKLSAKVLKDIFEEYTETLPSYVRELSYSDYFGDKAVGKNAMKKIVAAWENDRKNFKVDKKKNALIYTYADSSRTYELKYLQQELPPILNARVIGSSLVMDLDKSNKVFEVNFKRGIWG